MDRRFKISTNILICVIILVGFVAMALTSYNAYSRIITDDIMNISRLTSTNIYAEIRNELTKPVFVSLTMANDSFLKKWLCNEQTLDSPAHQDELRQYLLGLKEKYGYDSVFLVSEATQTYYHYNGINKVVSESDSHDDWYFNFRASGLTYDLEVDTDEANYNRLSVFVNCRMTDENGNLLGVTGVGLEVDHVQDMMRCFEDEYGLETMLFDQDGLIQVDTDLDRTTQENVFDNGVLAENREAIISDLDTMQVFPYRQRPFDGYYITRYVEELDWYLLVKKDTSVLEKSMNAQLVKDIIIYVLVAACVVILANRIIRKNDALMLNITKTDMLTGLPNRRGFDENMEQALAQMPTHGPLYVFVLDVDNFKVVNDTYGHLVGDKVLHLVAHLVADAFSDGGRVCRWGGDEFAGYGFGECSRMEETLDRLFESIRSEPTLVKYHTSVSMGVTCAREGDNVHTLIYRADQALYEAKGSGKNRYRVADVQKPEQEKD